MKFMSKSKSKSCDEKLPRNVGAIFFQNIEKSGIRTTTGDTHESGNIRYADFSVSLKNSW
jgi:hypothetical protein